MNMQTDIFGVKVDSCTLQEALARADEIIRAKKPEYLTVINLYQVVLCKENEQMMDFNNRASLTIVESANVIRLAESLGTHIKEKIDAMNYTYALCEMAAEKGYSVFFLGGSPGAAESAAEKLREISPSLNVAGTYAPPYGFEKDEAELEKIVAMLKDAHADILFVGLGSPKQDNFIEKYREAYDIPFSLSIGRVIDIISGQFKRAPKWVSNLGMEWLYRCFKDPKMFKRKYFSRGIKVLKYYWEYKTKKGDERQGE